MNNENKTAMPQLPPDAILSQMLFGGLMQQSISIAAKFGIADLVVEKPQTAEELAAETETHAPSFIAFFVFWQVSASFRKLLTGNSS